MYDPEEIPVPDNFMPEHPFDNGELKIRDEQLEEWPRTEEAIQQHIADYYGMISHIDQHIGRIMETLWETGHLDNTIIVFAGDNGLALGQHGLMGKQNLYEHSIHVPLIFAGVGIPEREKREEFAYLQDIYPTLCDLIGIPPPDTVEGHSLRQIIQDDSTGDRAQMYYAYMAYQRAVRDGDLKLIEYAVDGNRQTQLFNLQEDPWELNDLSDDPEYQEDVERLRQSMIALKEQYDDDYEEFWNYMEFYESTV
jgi:arylsulfatase A-like enzyme